MRRKTEAVEPPDHLSDRSKVLWGELAPDRAKSIERRTLLQAALEALDRADAARLAIAAEGMTTTTATTKAVHVHPLVKVEREARGQFMRAWAMLHLTWGAADSRAD